MLPSLELATADIQVARLDRACGLISPLSPGNELEACTTDDSRQGTVSLWLTDDQFQIRTISSRLATGRSHDRHDRPSWLTPDSLGGSWGAIASTPPRTTSSTPSAQTTAHLSPIPFS